MAAAGLSVLVPDWPAPPAVRAVATTRLGGISRGPWASLNLGAHVGDEPAAVAENRRRLAESLSLPESPRWLKQVHGRAVAHAEHDAAEAQADAMMSRTPGLVCAVLTADCLPVLLCDAAGRAVIAAHAGWRGLAGGVLEAAVDALWEEAEEPLLAWIGPAIGPDAYEVGAEVRDALLARDPQAESAFRAGRPGHWYLDLALVARQQLVAAGVGRVFGGRSCTFSDPAHFFSHRRDGQCGRQATLIWLAG